MSISKQNPDILLEYHNIYSVLDIQVLNDNIKKYYIDSANKFNAKLFTNPVIDNHHVLFPLICPDDLLIPVYHSAADIVPFNTQVKIKVTYYTKTMNYPADHIRIITKSKHLCPIISTKYDGIVEGTIFNADYNNIYISSYEPLLYIETWHPMVVNVVDNISNTNRVQPIII